MNPILLPLRKKLNDDPWMKSCCLCHTKQSIEFNHALIYSGRQINEDYAIVPLCSDCHRGAFGTILQRNRDICELLAIERGLQSDIETKYPKMDWRQRRDYLGTKLALQKYEKN